MSDFTVDVIDDQLNVTVDVTPESTPIVIEVGTQGPEGTPGPAGTTDHLNLLNIGTNTHAQIDSHISNTSNPHSVTKSQIGLGNVDNTSDLDKPISTATQTALDGKVDENVAITGSTKTKITYDSKGLVTAGADITTSDLPIITPSIGGFGLSQLPTNISTTGTINNLTPTTGYLNFTGSGSVTLTGVVAQTQGARIIIQNSLSTNQIIQILSNNAGSTAANRFVNPNSYPIVIQNGETNEFIYKGSYWVPAEAGVNAWTIGGNAPQTGTAYFGTKNTANIVGIQNGYQWLGVDKASNTGQLVDLTSGTVSVDFVNRNLRDSSSNYTMDWQNRYLYNIGSDIVVDWGNSILSYNLVTTLNWSVGQLYDSSTQASIDWFNRYAYDNFGTTAMSWQSGNRVLLDDASFYSINWGTRSLYSNDGIISIGWQDRYLNNSLSYTTVNYEGCYLNDSLGAASIDWNNKYLVYNTSVVADWATLVLNDYSATPSIYWANRYLKNTSNITVFDWSLNQIYSAGGTKIADFYNASGMRLGPSVFLGSVFSLAPQAALHVDKGTSVAAAIKFTAGTTTGQTVTDGFDIGISSTGVAEIRQREALALLFYTSNTNFMSLAATSPTLTLDSQGSNSANAGTIIFRTAGGSESFTQAFDASANTFTWSYGATAAMRIDSAAKLSIYQGTTLRGAVATVYSQINSVGNVGVGENNLHSFSVPSSGFAANGDSFEVKCSGTFAANANNKRVKLKFGAITLFDTTALAFNTGDWEISARIFRTSTTTGKSVVTWTCNNATLTTTTDYQSWAFNFLTSNTLVVTGEATANNDIVQELMQVFWIPVS